jgi:hypothetical protein
MQEHSLPVLSWRPVLMILHRDIRHRRSFMACWMIWKMEDLAESGSYKTVFRKQERIKQNHIVQLHRTAEQHRMLHQIPKMYEKVQCRIRQYRIPGEIKKHQIFRILQKENVL